MAQTQQLGLAAEKSINSQKKSVDDFMISRQTPELVFAIIEPIGGGAQKVVETLETKLRGPGYVYDDVHIIRLSQIIEEQASHYEYEEPSLHRLLENLPKLSEQTTKSNKLQQWGNLLRKEFSSPDFLARQAIRKISSYRVSKTERSGNTPIRVAHIIRSLKNEYELEILQKIYGNMLITISVSNNKEKRIDEFFKLRPKGEESNIDEELSRSRCEREYERLSEIDQYENNKYGQRVRKVFFKADLFLNSGNNLEEQIEKFLELLFGVKIHHPNTDESMIFKAYGASLQSTCLSRQVGAAIANGYGELISIGWNDIPRYGGGLAQAANELEFKASCKYKAECNSQKNITKIKTGLKEAIEELDVIKGKKNHDREVNISKIEKVIDESEISTLTEFSRAVHAEMEAILHAARNGGGNLRGATLYVTTYPCENCVKHILAAGIKEVIYIEPYPKSRAADFYGEFIVDFSSDAAKAPPRDKLVFRQFTGISPTLYSKCFGMGAERKSPTGKLCEQIVAPLPLTSPYIDDFQRYELEIAKEMVDKEKVLKNENTR